VGYEGQYQDVYEASRVEVLDQLATMQDEDDLDAILGQIEDRAATSLHRYTRVEASDDAEEAIDLAASVEAWASLVSYAMQRYYVEGPPEIGAARLRKAGMSKRIAARLIAGCSFARVVGSRRGRHQLDTAMEDRCAAVAVTVRYDRDERSCVAGVARARGGVDTLTKETASPGRRRSCAGRDRTPSSRVRFGWRS
jgi:hypothetical protein